MRRLLVRPGAIGDCLLSFPALEFLKAAYTEIWVPTSIVPLVDFADRVCSISSTGIETFGVGDISVDATLLDRLKSFDEIVSWYGTNREEFRSALSSLGVPCRFHQALPPANCATPAIDFFCAQVGAAPGSVPRVKISCATAPRNATVIHPFSGSASKNWPLPSFQHLAEHLEGEVEWLAGPEEELPEAHRFHNLRSLAEWLGGARLYVGNDSGITHLAAAAGVPTVALFGPTSRNVWSPRGDHVTIVQQEDVTVDSLLALIATLP